MKTMNEEAVSTEGRKSGRTAGFSDTIFRIISQLHPPVNYAVRESLMICLKTVNEEDASVTG